MPPTTRRSLLGACCAAALSASPWTAVRAQATTWPARPIHFIVPVGPGGSIDTTARLLAERMRAELGQTIIVENKPGASNTIGGDFVAKAPKDGYTVLVTGVGGRAVLSAIADKMPYDPERDLQPVGRAVSVPQVIVAVPRLKVFTVADLVALSKTRPQGLNLGSLGASSLTQMVAEMLKRDAGLNMLSVPYKGASPALLGMLSGELDFMVADAAVVMPAIRDNKLVALAVTGARRLQALPGVPTLAEAGFPRVVMESSYGLYVPTGTPREIVQRMNQALRAVLAQPALQKVLQDALLQPAPSSPDDYEAELARLTAQLRPIAIELGITLN